MKRIGILILALTVSLAAGAQTLEQGKKLFTQGDYEKAKPIMLKYLKQKPDDASRNYWYGVCCLETGEGEKAVPYLEKAAGKKIWKAYRAMGQYYQAVDMYQEAISSYESYVSGIASDPSLHDPATEQEFTTRADSLRMAFRMLRNTSRVTFIDSFLVRKDELLGTYITGPSTGRLSSYADFFEPDAADSSDLTAGEVFIPEMENQVYFSRLETDSLYHLYTRYRSGGKWIDETPLKGLESGGDKRFPFVLNDGVTIYYAATGSESLGGLDIFVSRFNTATGRYLKPENIGMPFNSAANDYLYVVDETNRLGFFATDRRQPQDTVCVYIFIPSDSNRKYVYEGGDSAAVKRAADLISIDESQTDDNEVRQAVQRLLLLRYELAEQAERKSFTFVIDDFTLYHEVSDFKCPDAAAMFERWTGMKKEYESDAARLEKQRMAFHDAGRQEREAMRGQLLEFEERVLDAERRIIGMENEIRTTEINYLNR